MPSTAEVPRIQIRKTESLASEDWWPGCCGGGRKEHVRGESARRGHGEGRQGGPSPAAAKGEGVFHCPQLHPHPVLPRLQGMVQPLPCPFLPAPLTLPVPLSLQGAATKEKDPSHRPRSAVDPTGQGTHPRSWTRHATPELGASRARTASPHSSSLLSITEERPETQGGHVVYSE